MAGAPVGARILLTVAGEEHDLRETLQAALLKRGWRVTTAQTRRDVVDSLRKAGPFDLLLFNEELPRVIGLDALPKAREAGVKAPALVLTGSLDLTRTEADTLGVSTIRKPVASQAVVAEIERLLTAPRADSAL